ncbi:hypothetical protein [Bacillus sp. B1-b2]|uniref:hypothetical protein n=1 Tax=Bacillus sp. B1-b2 TaxID=2653201 RepID=UPI00186A9A5A|nr:hypothetical protein [Bacillus sp. B1-b2]
MVTFLFRAAFLMIIIFGGIFTIQYFRTGDILLVQLIGLVIGVILLVSAVIMKKIDN